MRTLLKAQTQSLRFLTSLPGGVRGFVTIMSVRLSVCITRKPHCQTLSDFVCMCRWSWLGCDTLCTSGFMDKVMFHTTEPVGQNRAQRCVKNKFPRWRYQLDVRQLQCLVGFIRMRHGGGRATSDIYHFLVHVCGARSLHFLSPRWC